MITAIVKKTFLIALMVTGFHSLAFSDVNDWAEGGPDQNGGATRKFYNMAGKLPWENFMGDWVDESDLAQGLSPYSHAVIADNDKIQTVEWDITGLAKGWLEGEFQNHGIFLHALAGTGSVKFRSREYIKNKDHRPQLIMELEDGKILEIEVEADTYLDPSTYKSLGNREELRVGIDTKRGYNCLVRFPMDGLSNESVKSARLKMTCFAQYGSKHIMIGAFRSYQGVDSAIEVKKGLADHYFKDDGLSNHPDVIFATGFEKNDWKEKWSTADHNYDVIEADRGKGFEPFSGHALRLWLVNQSHYGSSLTYKFKDKTGSEPEEIFFRYYLRLGNNWNQTVSSGKLPGISGTYGRAGWGARKSDGKNGWSARGLFLRTVQEKTNPLFGRTPIGTYCYNVDQSEKYGDVWVWGKGGHGFLVPNQWYCIEQYVKLNSPDQKNGVIRAWVDGFPVFEKQGIVFRLTDELKIEQIWLNLYHGGKRVSPYDQDIYIDNLVIAKRYIGQIGMDSGKKRNAKLKDSTESLSIIDWYKRFRKLLK